MNHLIDMIGQVNKLKNGTGIQSLLDSAYKILGNPIAMFNTEYTLLAHTEAVTDDPLWNELITYGTFSKESQEFFDTEGFIEDLANASKIAFLTSDKLKYDRINGKLFNRNNSYVSNLIIVACNKPFDKECDSIVFEKICKIISREISRDEFYQEYEQIHQELIINKLIDGNYDKKLDIGQVGIIYDSLESNLYTVVADMSLCACDKKGITYFRDLFKQAKPEYKYTIHDDYIVIIVSTNDDDLNVNKALCELIKIFEQNNIYAGISRRFENLFELGKSYTEALKMMEYIREIRSTQRIFPYKTKSIDTMEKINAIKNGEGIQYFLNIGAEIFANPILFHDMELNLLGYTENMEIADPIWQELIAYGTGSNETIELFRSENFIEIMDDTKGGALLISEKIKYDRISWRIYNNDNIRIGCTSIVNTMKPFCEDELALFGAFSQKFSKEIKRIEFYNKYGQVYSGTIINRLLSGKIDNYTFYSEDIGNLYDCLMDNLYLMVIDISYSESENINLTIFRNLFNWPGTVNRYAIYDDYIIIIISIADKLKGIGSELEKIRQIFAENNIYAGISNCFENIYDVQSHYNQAVEALNFGMNRKGKRTDGRIFQYNTSCYQA